MDELIRNIFRFFFFLSLHKSAFFGVIVPISMQRPQAQAGHLRGGDGEHPSTAERLHGMQGLCGSQSCSARGGTYVTPEFLPLECFPTQHLCAGTAPHVFYKKGALVFDRR